MKNTIIFLTLFFFCACSSNVEQKTVNVAPDTKINQRPEAVSQSTALQRDTTPPARKRPNYVVDTARPASEINTAYPYDIQLKAATGEVFNSAELLKPNSKPTVLLFWLTTCAPCAMEMKAISKQYAAWQKETDFRLVAISTDFPKNYPNFVKRVEEKQWPWETYYDVNREFRRVMPGGLNGLPQSFILDKEGNIALHKRKYRPGDEEALYAKVKELAAK